MSLLNLSEAAWSSLSWVAIAFSTYWLLWIAYSKTLHPLAGIPGPFFASVTRLWYVRQIWRGDMQKTQRLLHAQHGPLVRIAPDEVSVSDATAVPAIYRHSHAFDKTEFYPVWNSAHFSKHRDLFSETSEVKYAQRRRIVSPVYSMTNVLKSEQYIEPCIALLEKRLDVFAESGEPCDLGQWMQMYAYDVMGELYFGRMFGFLEHSEDHGNWMKSLSLLLPFLCMCAVAPTYVRPFILGTALFIPGAAKAVKAVKIIENAARSCVKERLASKNDENGNHSRNDMLEQLYALYQEKGDKVDFGIGDMEQESYIAIGSGSDTTSIALRSIFYHLMKNPELYEELKNEIDTATATGKLSNPVKYAEAAELPLMCAVVKEALRIHPAIQLSLPRLVPKGGLHVCGAFIPAGYKVGMNALLVHLDRDVFGPDAEEFNPSRWLQPNTADMDRAFLSFGGGSRTCTGKNISIAEMYKLVPGMLRRYKMELCEPEKDWVIVNYGFAKQKGVVVRLTRLEY